MTSSLFRAIAAVCVLFVVLTVVAMLTYGGGTAMDPASPGYSFFRNFFSDLGMTRTPNGSRNIVSMVLLITALTTTGIGLGAFFIAFAGFFTESRASRWLSAAAAVAGVVAGLSFIGVAATPWDLYLAAHNRFVFWAFQAFLAATLLDIAAVWSQTSVPRRFAWVFAAFAVVLGGYVALLHLGPAPTTHDGLLIQATGQKVIAFASVLTVLVQALSADRYLARATAS